MRESVPEALVMIDSHRAGPVAIVRMTHGRANAMDIEFLRALREEFARLATSDARACVLTGRGNIFCAGVDLVKLLAGGKPYLETFLPELSACLRSLFEFPKPVVAAVNGHAIAGGCLLTCLSDHRLMARGSGRIGIPELRVGVPFPLAALEIMRFALPAHAAQEAIMLGRTYEPERALALGMLDEIVEPAMLMDRALAVAEELAAIAPSSFARSKRDLRRPVFETWAGHSTEHDRETLERWGSEEVQSAVRQYVEKTLKK